MQTLPLNHALTEFPLLIVFFHGGTEKLMVAVEFLRSEHLGQNGNPRFVDVDLSFDPLDLVLHLLNFVGIDLLLSRLVRRLRSVAAEGTCEAEFRTSACAFSISAFLKR